MKSTIPLYYRMRNATKPCRLCGCSEGYDSPIREWVGFGGRNEVLVAHCRKCRASHYKSHFKESRAEILLAWIAFLLTLTTIILWSIK